MPVTKQVASITIGPLGRDSSCAADITVALEVRKEGGAWTTSSNRPTLTITPAIKTFSFPSLVLQKGANYDLRIKDPRYNCQQLQRTTWAHNSATVDGGDASCVETDSTTTISDTRVWHVQGQNDVPACLFTTPSNFDPSLPTGWLMVRGGPYVVSNTAYRADGSTTPPTSGCSSMKPTYGVAHQYWRPALSPPPPSGWQEWACYYPQFGTEGVDVADGWYYASSWRTLRDGAPSDMYLRIESIDYTALLNAHTPELRYDSTENFRADSPALMTDNPGNELNRSGSTVIAPALSMSFLGATYSDGATAAASDAINARGDSENEYLADAGALRATSASYRDKVYGHAAYDNGGKLWLQYWIFYYANPQEQLGEGKHEGDWEMVQVRLNSALQPDKATYAQHSAAQSKAWSDVTTTDGGARPVVFPASGSHASYFSAGSNLRLPCPTDYFDGNGGGVIPEVVEVKSADVGWSAWPGRWGATGPEGPTGRLAWSDPGTWSDTTGTDTCTG